MSTTFRQTHKFLLLQHLCFSGNGLKMRVSAPSRRGLYDTSPGKTTNLQYLTYSSDYKRQRQTIKVFLSRATIMLQYFVFLVKEHGFLVFLFYQLGKRISKVPASSIYMAFLRRQMLMVFSQENCFFGIFLHNFGPTRLFSTLHAPLFDAFSSRRHPIFQRACPVSCPLTASEAGCTHQGI